MDGEHDITGTNSSDNEYSPWSPNHYSDYVKKNSRQDETKSITRSNKTDAESVFGSNFPGFGPTNIASVNQANCADTLTAMDESASNCQSDDELSLISDSNPYAYLADFACDSPSDSDENVEALHNSKVLEWKTARRWVKKSASCSWPPLPRSKTKRNSLQKALECGVRKYKQKNRVKHKKAMNSIIEQISKTNI